MNVKLLLLVELVSTFSDLAYSNQRVLDTECLISSARKETSLTNLEMSEVAYQQGDEKPTLSSTCMSPKSPKGFIKNPFSYYSPEKSKELMQSCKQTYAPCIPNKNKEKYFDYEDMHKGTNLQNREIKTHFFNKNWRFDLPQRNKIHSVDTHEMRTKYKMTDLLLSEKIKVIEAIYNPIQNPRKCDVIPRNRPKGIVAICKDYFEQDISISDNEYQSESDFSDVSDEGQFNANSMRDTTPFQDRIMRMVLAKRKHLINR